MTTITGGPLSSGSYYFKIDATGKIYKKSLWDANPSPFPSGEMTSKFSGNNDDGSYTLNPMDDAGFNVSFLGTMYFNIFVSGNGAVAFGTQNNGSADVNGATASNIPCLLMNANDGNLQHIYTIWSGSPGNRILVYKIQGNTNYVNNYINYDYDIYFYEATGYIDVVVNLEPTSLSAYTDSLFPPKWGVTNGYNWVDGLFHHNKSIGSVGVRINGGLKIKSSSSFTIYAEDLSSPFEFYSGYTDYTTAGFTSTGGEFIYNGMGFIITQSLVDRIADAQTRAGFTPPGAYAWNVTWNTGGSNIVRLGLNANGPYTVVIAPIDQTDPAWQSGNNVSATLAGTFTFPAVFTPYFPVTQIQNANQWC